VDIGLGRILVGGGGEDGLIMFRWFVEAERGESENYLSVGDSKEDSCGLGRFISDPQ